MTFTATATIQSIEKLNEKFFKVLLQDDRKNHIIVNVPIEKGDELVLNTKVSIWGNVSAFQYQSKWYNNLFAQTVVPENKKYILLQHISSVEGAKESYKVIEYSSELFTREYITGKYKTEESVTAENEESGKEKVLVSSHKQMLLDSLHTTKRSQFVNIEYSQLQNWLSKKLITLESNLITLLDDTAWFEKEVNKCDLIIFFKSDAGKTTIVSIEEVWKKFAP